MSELFTPEEEAQMAAAMKDASEFMSTFFSESVGAVKETPSKVYRLKYYSEF